MDAVKLVHSGWSIRKVARHLGYDPATVSRWTKKAELYGGLWIPTESSKPHHHPNELSEEIVDKIIEQRLKRNRCAEVVHQELLNQGILVSLSSVKRTLRRRHLLKERSPWKRWHQSGERPLASEAGSLVEIDTIHVVPKPIFRFYVYTLIDVYSRWAHAKALERMNTHKTISFVREAQKISSFKFNTLQSDHGPEFSVYFSEQIQIPHRHIRVRQPNDDAHIERFNRTLQEECLNRVSPSPKAYQKAINEYLPYYNNERLHLSLNFKTPTERSQAID
jgi:transposase InsO family protein